MHRALAFVLAVALTSCGPRYGYREIDVHRVELDCRSVCRGVLRRSIGGPDPYELGSCRVERRDPEGRGHDVTICRMRYRRAPPLPIL